MRFLSKVAVSALIAVSAMTVSASADTLSSTIAQGYQHKRDLLLFKVAKLMYCQEILLGQKPEIHLWD